MLWAWGGHTGAPEAIGDPDLCPSLATCCGVSHISSENIPEGPSEQDPLQATDEKQCQDSGLSASHSLSFPICLVILYLPHKEKHMEASVWMRWEYYGLFLLPSILLSPHRPPPHCFPPLTSSSSDFLSICLPLGGPVGPPWREGVKVSFLALSDGISPLFLLICLFYPLPL